MSLIPTHPEQVGRSQPEDLRVLPTDTLIRRIADHGERAALDEFHSHRRVFRIRDGSPLLLAEFVRAVLNGERGGGFLGLRTQLLDRAYDLTVDKFCRLPGATDALQGRDGHVKGRGTDCRYYFRMLAGLNLAWKNRHPEADSLAIEAAVAQILQRRVACHCWLSCLEAGRSLWEPSSRFTWCLSGGAVTVWMPRWLSRRQRRAWLEANVPFPDLSCVGEKQRIQATIDAHFGTLQPVMFDECAHKAKTAPGYSPAIDELIEHELTHRGLAEFVAREKCIRIGRQRTTIRRLGKKRLTRLILGAFENHVSAPSRDNEIAAAFGLSFATYSRFAGRDWGLDSKQPIPDLWLNAARVVASFGPFRDLAQSAGILDKIEEVVLRYGDWEPIDE